MENELFKKVFRYGLAKNGTKENLEIPILILRYKIFCEQMISQNSNVDLDTLCDLAKVWFVSLKRNPDGKIPVLSI